MADPLIPTRIEIQYRCRNVRTLARRRPQMSRVWLVQLGFRGGGGWTVTVMVPTYNPEVEGRNGLNRQDKRIFVRKKPAETTTMLETTYRLATDPDGFLGKILACLCGPSWRLAAHPGLHVPQESRLRKSRAPAVATAEPLWAPSFGAPRQPPSCWVSGHRRARSARK